MRTINPKSVEENNYPTSLVVSMSACVAVFALEATQLKGQLIKLKQQTDSTTAAREKGRGRFR